jgi:hypothetical protein
VTSGNSLYLDLFIEGIRRITFFLSHSVTPGRSRLLKPQWAEWSPVSAEAFRSKLAFRGQNRTRRKAGSQLPDILAE